MIDKCWSEVGVKSNEHIANMFVEFTAHTGGSVSKTESTGQAQKT